MIHILISVSFLIILVDCAMFKKFEKEKKLYKWVLNFRNKFYGNFSEIIIKTEN